jgi:hypothetical protein
VRTKAKLKSPGTAVPELHAQRGDQSGNPVGLFQPFSTLHVINTSVAPVSVRVVCIIWDPTPPGSPQQIFKAIPLTGLAKIDRTGEPQVPVTGPAKDHTELCDGIKVYLSR